MSDKEIIARMGEDPQKGFALLMGEYMKPVYMFARRMLVSHDDAQDAAQETFVRVYRSFGQFRGNSLKSWIYKIAANESLRVISRRRQDRCDIDGAEVLGLYADEYVDYSDLQTVKLQKAVLSLPTKQQLAFNLRYYDEMDYEDIAKVLDSNALTVKANYHVAKGKIIKYMQTHD